MTTERQALVLDTLAAQDVIARYAACIDDGDFVAFRECFTEDVEFHGFGREVVRGIDAWLAFVERALAPYSATQHLLGPARVELRDAEADLRAELQAQHFFSEPAGGIFTLWGTYRSRLVRQDGIWRIRRHSLDVRATRVVEPTAK